MTLTPLHFAFVWFFKLKFKVLSIAGLSIGSFVPDLEPLVAFTLGQSVFCGWDFPCTLAPDRLVLHSITGALTVDVGLTMAIVALLGRFLDLERIGVYGFSKVKVTRPNFCASAAIGSVSHVLVDWLHHPANPVFWPFAVDGSYYVGGPLLPYFTVLHASILVGVVAAVLTAAAIVVAIRKCGRSPWIMFSNPPLALSLVTRYYSSNET